MSRFSATVRFTSNNPRCVHDNLSIIVKGINTESSNTKTTLPPTTKAALSKPCRGTNRSSSIGASTLNNTVSRLVIVLIFNK